MVDSFFSDKKRPFSKRKGDDAGATASSKSRSGVSSRGSALTRGGRGGKRGGAAAGRNGERGRAQGKGKRRADDEDEELDVNGGGGFDSDEEDGDGAGGAEYSSEEDDDLETPAQKRLRLSQMYLKSLEKDKEEEVGFDAADLDRDIIAERLQQDVLEHTGKLHLKVGSTLQLPIPSTSIFRTPAKGHRGTVTSAVASHDGHWLYTSSKDGAILKYDLSAVTSSSPSASSSSTSEPSQLPRITRSAYFPRAPSESLLRKAEKQGKVLSKGKGKEENALPTGHTDEILDLAISADGRVLASGGRDKVIGCWDVAGEGGKWTRGLGGHKDAVASISFRLGTQQLYSSSFDRTVKLFDLSTLSYIETLFGHQDQIQSIDALRGELAVTAGGRDKTVRYWKVTEESQFVFRGGGASRLRNVLEGAMEDEGIEEEEEKVRRKRREEEKGPVKFVEGSVDCVAMVDDSTLLSGGDSGSICLWTITKKKPVFTQSLAHGINEHASETEGIIGTPRYITALSTLPYSDVFASGSWDGHIRLWKIDDRIRSFSALTTIAAPGFVNSLQLTAPALSEQAAVTMDARLPPGQARRKKEQEDEERQKRGKALMVVAATSKEPRLGRWMRFKEAKDGALVAVIPMQQ
ncbi:hypothetical protein JCM8547_005719 [Rhodosporidiobolus lusitaniae]